MNRGSTAARFASALVATLISALAFYFGTGLHPVWWLAWLAALPPLLMAPGLSRWSAFVLAWLAAALGATNLWTYFRDDLQNPLLLCAVVVVLPSAVFAAGVLLFRRCVLRGSVVLAALAFPSFWVTYEYLQAISSPHSTALNLAYSQMNFLPVLQIASITGIWGISFCLFLLPATLAALLVAPGAARRKRWLAVFVAAFLLTVLAFGAWRLSRHDKSNTLPVALIASDLRQNSLPKTKEDSLRLFREYAAEIDQLSSEQPAVFVLPEKIAVVRESYVGMVDSLFSSAASRARAAVVLGVIRSDGHVAWNEARVYLPEGGPPLTYEKHHMLPAFESQFVVGTALLVMARPSGTWGIAICKDMDFPTLSRDYARQNAALLLVPAWDFDSDGWLHGRMAILRGIENGFSIARAPRHGILTVTDDRGRVLAERSTASAPFANLVAEAPVVHRSTLYSKSGDWFAWLCLLALLICYLASRRRGPPAVHQPHR